MVKTRECTKCGEVKSLDQFYRAKGKKYGRAASCAVCCRKHKELKRREKGMKPQEFYNNTKTLDCGTIVRSCNKCKQTKEISDFTKDSTGPKGRGYVCKVCNRLYIKMYDKKIRKQKPRCIVSNCNNYQKTKNFCRRHYTRHINNQYPLEISLEEWVKNDRREKALNILTGLPLKKLSYKTKEQRAEARKKSKNRSRALQKKNNPYYKLSVNLRKRIRKILKRSKEYSGSCTRPRFSENLGCRTDEFVRYIESQWEPWMNWDNYGCLKGQWSLDHIIPVKWFVDNNLDVRKSNFFKNLQPICATKNSQKKAALPPVEQMKSILDEIGIDYSNIDLDYNSF